LLHKNYKIRKTVIFFRRSTCNLSIIEFMDNSNKLNKEQKQAIGLLSVGTFLEYFDLMLYVHMAVLLNELFFPKTDPFTASLLSAFAFCWTSVKN
jgi:MHS family proline/betaine transporter-like MFS transporter